MCWLFHTISTKCICSFVCKSMRYTWLHSFFFFFFFVCLFLLKICQFVHHDLLNVCSNNSYKIYSLWFCLNLIQNYIFSWSFDHHTISYFIRIDKLEFQGGNIHQHISWTKSHYKYKMETIFNAISFMKYAVSRLASKLVYLNYFWNAANRRNTWSVRKSPNKILEFLFVFPLLIFENSVSNLEIL